MPLTSPPSREFRRITLRTIDCRTVRARRALFASAFWSSAGPVLLLAAALEATLLGTLWLAYGLIEVDVPRTLFIAVAVSGPALLFGACYLRFVVLGNTRNLTWGKELGALAFESDRILELPYKGTPVAHRYDWLRSARWSKNGVRLTVLGSSIAPLMNETLRIQLRLTALDGAARQQMQLWIDQRKGNVRR